MERGDMVALVDSTMIIDMVASKIGDIMVE